MRMKILGKVVHLRLVRVCGYSVFVYTVDWYAAFRSVVGRLVVSHLFAFHRNVSTLVIT